MINVEKKACHRCGGQAKGAVVLAEGRTTGTGEAYAACNDCLALVRDIMQSVEPVIQVACKHDSDVLILDWAE